MMGYIWVFGSPSRSRTIFYEDSHRLEFSWCYEASFLSNLLHEFFSPFTYLPLFTGLPPAPACCSSWCSSCCSSGCWSSGSSRSTNSSLCHFIISFSLINYLFLFISSSIPTIAVLLSNVI